MEHDWNTILYVVIAVIAMAVSALGKKKERSNSRTGSGTNKTSYDPMEEPQNNNPFGDFNLKDFFGENDYQQEKEAAADSEEEYNMETAREEPERMRRRQYHQYAEEQESPTLNQAYSKEKTLADRIKNNEGEQAIKMSPAEYEQFRDENEITDVIAEGSIKGEGENEQTAEGIDFSLREAVIYSEILNRKEF